MSFGESNSFFQRAKGPKEKQMGRSKRSSAVAAKLRMDDIIQSSDSEVDLPPRKKSKSKTLQLTYSAPRSVRKKAAKKLPEFLIHHDDDSEDSVILDERVLALEAWIDDDEQDKIRPNGECRLPPTG